MASRRPARTSRSTPSPSIRSATARSPNRGRCGTPSASCSSWASFPPPDAGLSPVGGERDDVRFPRVRRRLLAALVVVAGALSIGLPGPAQSAPAPIYVALGDSYAAGPIIPVPIKPWGCLKSSNNYAHMLASTYSLTLRDATCSGAETDDMTNPQGVDPDGPNPPQFDSLSADVSLVTLQIGGNDIGFGGIAETCARAAFAQQSCESQYVKNGDDELRDRIAATGPKVAAVIQEIHTRAPSATVLVLGYPGIFMFGPTASCPAMLVGEGDALYLRGIQEALNGMIAEQAAANSAT